MPMAEPTGKVDPSIPTADPAPEKDTLSHGDQTQEPPSSTDEPTGQSVPTGYELEGEIGRGGMGSFIAPTTRN